MRISEYINALSRQPDASVCDLIATLKSVGDITAIRSFISGLMRDDTALSAIAKNSYPHSNGFDKLTLAVSEAGIYGPRIRLHIWWEPPQADQVGMIHNHAWDFASYILCGVQHAELFERCTSGPRFNEYRCPTLATRAQLSKPEYIGVTHLKQSHFSVLRQGSIYATAHQLIHRVIPAEGYPVATLVLQGRHEATSTSLFGVGHADEVEVFPGRNFKAEEVGKKLISLHDHLSGSI